MMKNPPEKLQQLRWWNENLYAALKFVFELWRKPCTIIRTTLIRWLVRSFVCLLSFSYTHIHIHIHTHTFTYSHIRIHTHTHTCAHTSTVRHRHMHIHNMSPPNRKRYDKRKACPIARTNKRTNDRPTERTNEQTNGYPTHLRWMANGSTRFSISLFLIIFFLGFYYVFLIS